MIAFALLALLAQSDNDAVASVAPWVSILTGSGGALAVLGFWVKTLLAEKKEMIESHREKDRELVAITRESIACIEASIGRADLEDDFRKRLEALLARIESKLSTLD